MNFAVLAIRLFAIFKQVIYHKKRATTSSQIFPIPMCEPMLSSDFFKHHIPTTLKYRNTQIYIELSNHGNTKVHFKSVITCL